MSEEFRFPNKRSGGARNSGADVARAGKVAGVAEGRRAPGKDATDKQHAKDMAKINKHVEGQNKR